MSTAANVPPPPLKLTTTHWLILAIAALGFAFDIYELLVLPIVARPALASMLAVDPDTASGNEAILGWLSAILWSSAVCGGVFGLLGGYLTDYFGRRRMLTWSILLYAFSALASGFATNPYVFLVLRCTTFIGVCLEFVAAVAWLAELFPNPRQRETVLGFTQAFSSVGGLMVTACYILVNQFVDYLPPLYGAAGDSAWRYTLISGVLPALPLIVIRPFLPESPAWERKRAAGTLKRPSFAELFRPAFARTTIVTALLFVCAYGAAFGAIQLTPQMVPGLVPALRPLPGLRDAYEGSLSETKRQELLKESDKLKEESAQAGPGSDRAKALKVQSDRKAEAYQKAVEASESEGKRQQLKNQVEELQRKQETEVGAVQIWQEVGGLAGRFALAGLALLIVSRRLLLWLFQVPGLLLIPLVYFFPASGYAPAWDVGVTTLANLDLLRLGMFVAGFFTVAQFSFWGNYLPRVYPTHLRGTGESFAANVGGRMFGTGANAVTTQLALPLILAWSPLLARPTALAYGAAAVVLGVYLAGTVLTSFLPEPTGEHED